MSKFAVRGLTESLRHELRHTGVTVICVHPGGVDTRIQERSLRSEDAAMTARNLKRIIKQMSAEQAAGIIVKGMLSRKERILVGRDARLLDLVVRLFPSGYHRVLGWLTPS